MESNDPPTQENFSLIPYFIYLPCISLSREGIKGQGHPVVLAEEISAWAPRMGIQPQAQGGRLWLVFGTCGESSDPGSRCGSLVQRVGPWSEAEGTSTPVATVLEELSSVSPRKLREKSKPGGPAARSRLAVTGFCPILCHRLTVSDAQGGLRFPLFSDFKKPFPEPPGTAPVPQTIVNVYRELFISTGGLHDTCVVKCKMRSLSSKSPLVG